MSEPLIFEPFPKIARLSRECVITEKIDGTNAQIYIGEDGEIRAGSRNRWLTPEADNFGFARWVRDHAEDLAKLGPGRHFGEWWGLGIQRGYGLQEKRFSLFNVGRWGAAAEARAAGHAVDSLPKCCDVVPVLYRGPFDTEATDRWVTTLRVCGSYAAPGFMQPEGIIVFHTAASLMFKKTLEGDAQPKGRAA